MPGTKTSDGRECQWECGRNKAEMKSGFKINVCQVVYVCEFQIGRQIETQIDDRQVDTERQRQRNGEMHRNRETQKNRDREVEEEEERRQKERGRKETREGEKGWEGQDGSRKWGWKGENQE